MKELFQLVKHTHSKMENGSSFLLGGKGHIYFTIYCIAVLLMQHYGKKSKKSETSSSEYISVMDGW